MPHSQAVTGTSPGKILTAEPIWSLIEALTDQLYRELAAIRRDRTATMRHETPIVFFQDVFFPEAKQLRQLQCIVWRHYDPTGRPRAWFPVEFRLGPSVGRDADGKRLWDKTLEVEARLPEAQGWEKETAETRWRTRGRVIRVKLRPKAARRLQRRAEQERVKRGESPRFFPQPLWIEPKRTPKEVTHLALALLLWREGMMPLNPQSTPKAWAGVKAILGRWVRDDGEAWLVLEGLRTGYAFPNRWESLPAYIARVTRALRATEARRETLMDPEAAEEQEARRRRGMPPRSTDPLRGGHSLISVTKGAEILGVRREKVYRWGREGTVPLVHSSDGSGRGARLDPSGLAAARRRIEERRRRKQIMEVLVERGGKTFSAAKKWIQRRLQGGKTLEQIAQEVLSGVSQGSYGKEEPDP